MRERIDLANRQAAEARERALQSTDPQMKDAWAKVARMWEELAHEYREVEKLRA